MVRKGRSYHWLTLLRQIPLLNLLRGFMSPSSTRHRRALCPKISVLCFLVACNATPHPTRSVGWWVGRLVSWSRRHILHFFKFLRSLSSLLMPQRFSDLKYNPCPPARDWGTRVSGLVYSLGPQSSYPNGPVTSSMSPDDPHATGVDLYPALFGVELILSPFQLIKLARVMCFLNGGCLRLSSAKSLTSI